MKKFVVLFASIVLILGFTVTANAILLTDTTTFTSTGTIAPEDYIDHGYGDVNKLDWTADYIAWGHQYSFSPEATSINYATLELTFVDDEGDRKYRAFTQEVGFGVAESFEWGLGDVDSDTYSYNIDVSYVGDGYFGVLVGSLWGDFTIESSVLTIDYNAAPVPEPATMLLLGTGLVGMAVGSRKKFLKK